MQITYDGPEADAIRARIRLLIKEKSTTQDRVAEAMGKHYTSVSRVLGRGIKIDSDWVSAFAAVLGETPESIIEPALSGVDDRRAAPRTARPRREVISANVPIPEPASMPRDLPVLGTAAGAIVLGKNFEGFSLDPTRIVDRVRRPPAVIGAPDAYAIYVVGDSMAPMHSAGELRIVHPGRPVRPGDTVIIQVRAGEGLPLEAFIKILLGRTAESVVARQINPEATHRFKASTVIAVHRVLTVAELVEA